MFPLAVVLAVHIGAAVAEPARCSVGALRANPEGYHYPLEDIRRFVRDADIVVRAMALDSTTWMAKAPQSHWDSHFGPAGVAFRVLEPLRGPSMADPLILPGVLVARDDFNAGPVPYRIVRSAGQRGDCFAREYRRGAEYLLLLQSSPSGPIAHWAPLAPVNEQLRGPDDPWLQWVRQELGQ